MNQLTTPEKLFSLANVTSRDGLVYLTVSVPSEVLSTVPALLDSIEKFYRLVKVQSSSSAAHYKAVDPVKIMERKDSFDLFCSLLFSQYDKHITSGLDSRSAIKQVQTFSASHGRHFTVETIQSLLRKSGRMKKSRGSVSVS